MNPRHIAEIKYLKKTFNYLSYCPIYCCHKGGFWQDGKWHNVEKVEDPPGEIPKRINERCDGEWHIYGKLISVGENKRVEYEFASPCPAWKQLQKLKKEIINDVSHKLLLEGK